jgi:hypothetical protein
MVSMKPMISGCGVEFPDEENHHGLQDRIVFLEPADLGPEGLDLRQLPAQDTRPLTIVNLALDHPAPHRLLADAELLGHHGRRRPQRRVLPGMVTDQPHRTSSQLWINLLRHGGHPSNSQRCGIEPRALH